MSGASGGAGGRDTAPSEIERVAEEETSLQQGEGYGVEPPGKRFVVEGENTQYLQRFRVTGKKLAIRLKNPPRGSDPFLWLEATIRDIHAYIVSLADPRSDLIGISVKSDSLAHGPAGLSLRPASDFSHEELWGLIEALAQSNEDLKIDETFFVEVILVDVPRGTGRVRGAKFYGVDAINQRSVVSIKNTDNLCLPRALVVGRANLELKENDTKETRQHWERIRDKRGKTQKRLAEQLALEARVSVPANGCGYRELEKFQIYFSRHGIAIVAYEKNILGSGEEPFFDGRPKVRGRLRGTIYVLYDPKKHHYDTITNIVGACKTPFYCENCNKRYWKIDDHRCSVICSACFVSPACESEGVRVIKCDTCNRNFFGEKCFENHNTRGTYKKNKKKLCDVLIICKNCSKMINKTRTKHICGEK